MFQTIGAWIQLQMRNAHLRREIESAIGFFFPFSETLMHVSQSKQMDHNKLRLLFVQTQAYCISLSSQDTNKESSQSKSATTFGWMDMSKRSTIKPYNEAPVRRHTGKIAIH